MKIRLAMMVSLVLGSIILLPALAFRMFPMQPEPHYIAVVGPLSGEDRVSGLAMQKGIQLCLERAKRQGRLKNKRIELVYFNDQNDRRTALKIAAQITKDDRILCVLGHFYSTSAEVAGAMYRRSGIPAITASAGGDSLTTVNDWYFRTIPDNRSMTRFTVSYIRKVLKQNRVSLIFDKGDYGAALAGDFMEAARELNMEILYQWSFDQEAKESQRQLNGIITELRTVKEPGVLYFATQAPEAAQILSAVRYQGTDYTVVGPDTFCNRAFIELFNRYPGERRAKGYFTDGIYAVAPFLPEMGGKTTHDFIHEYQGLYGEKPSWVACCYYDAMLMAINAIEKSDLEAGFGIQKIRRTLRDRLAGYTSADIAVDGVTGKLYFDRNRNMKRPLHLGYYQKQEFIPFFSQYTSLEGDQQPQKKRIKEKIADKVVLIDNQFHTDTQIVYVGFDINSIGNMDMEKQTFTLDFYLWFRFQGAFEEEKMIFPDALTPVRLENPIIREAGPDSTVQTYHIKADFKGDFNPRDYPFDVETLRIRFYDKSRSRNKMIYLPDILQPASGALPDQEPLPSTAGWQVAGVSCYEAIKDIAFSEKVSIPYSQFNVAVALQRTDRMGSALKLLLPLGALTALLFFSHYLPPDSLSRRGLIYAGIAAAAGMYHLHLHQRFPGKGLDIEHVYYVVYGLLVWAAAISAIGYGAGRMGLGPQKIQRLQQLGKIGYPIILLIGCLSVFFIANG